MNYSKFEPLLGTWGEKLKGFIESEKCDELYSFLKTESRRGKVICPDHDNVFRAFQETPYNDLKVVMMLQDPYYQVKFGEGHNTKVADGVAMSCRNTGKLQPSLELFYEGMEDDLYKGLNLKMEKNPDLTYLCKQGVMMLNTSLTVEQDKPSSHYERWKDFTTYLLEEVFTQYNNGLIFVLAGNKSQYYERFINPLQHYIFKVEHPAAAAHSQRKWKHDKIFSKINKILKENNNYQVTWDYGEIPF